MDLEFRVQASGRSQGLENFLDGFRSEVQRVCSVFEGLRRAHRVL